MNNRVKQLRKTLKLSGEKFGEKIGLTRFGVSNMETGKTGVTEQTIKSICREFNVNEDWLRHGTGEMFVSLSLEEHLTEWINKSLTEKSSDFKKRFVKILASLPEEGWLLLEEKIRELAKEEEKEKEKI